MTDAAPQAAQPDVDPAQLVAQVAAALRWARYTGAVSVDRAWTSVPDGWRQPQAEPAAPAVAAGPAVGTGSRPPAPLARPAQHQPVAAAALPPGRLSREEVLAGLAALREREAACQRCSRHQGRKNVVHGAGNPMARLLICQTTPTAEDDAAGLPAQGPGGELLRNMLKAMTLTTDDVWLTHLALCHAPADPDGPAMAECSRYLRTQLKLVSPAVVLVFGELPARFLLRQQVPVGTPWAEVRGQWYDLLEVPALATWGLADVLRQPALKKEVWTDLQRVMQRLGLR